MRKKWVEPVQNMRAILIVLIAATLSIPAASAWSADILFKMDSPSKFVMEAEARITGDDASQLRQQMDQAGNKDGTVQASEVTQVEDFFKQFMNQASDEGQESSIGSSFTIDGKAPNSFGFSRFDLEDAEGAVTSKDTITAFLDAEMLFDITPADNHTIRIMGDSDGDDEDDNNFLDQVESAKMRAAPGYIFSSVQGLPTGAKLSGDKKEIEFAGAVGPSTGTTTIIMSKGGGSAPSPAVLISVAAVLGVAAALRGRSKE